MYPLTMRQAPGLPGSWTGDAGARLPPAQKAGRGPEIALEKDPSSEQVDWRALLDSNQWPSASELSPSGSPLILESPSALFPLGNPIRHDRCLPSPSLAITEILVHRWCTEMPLS